MNENSSESLNVVVKAVFDHLRNIFLCTTLAATAASIPYFHEHMPLSYPITVIFALVLFASSLYLLYRNLTPVLNKVDPIFESASIMRRAIIVCGLAIYLNVLLALVVAGQRALSSTLGAG